VLFGLPVAAVLIVNVVLFSLSVRQIRGAAKASQLAVQKTDQTQLLVSMFWLDTALLEWISEYIVQAYATPDSVVSY